MGEKLDKFLNKLCWFVLGVLAVPLAAFLWLCFHSLYYFAYQYR